MSGQALEAFRPPWRARRVPDQLRPLLVLLSQLHPEADLAVMQRAYEVAHHWHLGYRRRSGDQYITHPLAVTTIVAHGGLDIATLVASMLHDTIGDTEYTLARLREDFGDDVAALVDGVTKLDEITFAGAATPDTIQQVIVAMAVDPRVLIIKLADRLHNMRTIAVQSRQKQVQKAEQTLQIFVPLAERLGMNKIRFELAHLALRTLHPGRYTELVDLIREAVAQRIGVLRLVTHRIIAELKAAGIRAEVAGQVLELYSLYQELDERGRRFDEVEDLVALHVLVDTMEDCYATLDVIHGGLRLVPDRFEDHIETLTPTMAWGLRTTVKAPIGEPVDIHIRTHAMHHAAGWGLFGRSGYDDR